MFAFGAMRPPIGKTHPVVRPVMRWVASTEELLRFERLVSELSAGFINLPATGIDAAIVDGLRRIVEALHIDRSTLSQVSPDTGHFRSTHSWAINGFPAVPTNTTSQTFPWVLATARAGKPIVFSKLDDLPPEASADKEGYRQLGLRSHVALPVLVAGELFAVLGLGSLQEERAWSDELVERLKLVAEIFASALARKGAHEDIDRALGFERLLVDISAGLLKRPADDPVAAINAALHAIGEFLQVQRAVLWSSSANGERFEPTHLWVGGGASSPPSVIDETMAPTVFRRVSGGEVVALSSIDNLPPEAEAERQEFRRFGTRALLAVPLVVEGLVIGALSLSDVHGKRSWPDSLIPRVQLIGEVFANVLTRRLYAARVNEAKSETAQYRERLAHLARVHTIGEMSAAIAHEVNQPLMAIENYALAAHRRLASDGVDDRVKLGALLDKIAGQAARAGDVLKRLRSIVKKHESEVTVFNLGTLVADTVNLVEVESRLKDVQVEIAVASDLPPVVADEVQIQQVVLNLVRNGIEAMDQPGIVSKVLRVEVQNPRSHELVVRVVDRGKGLSSIDREHIFEPFYSTKEKGLGIGLAICRSIIEAHGGKLSYSPHTGGGAVFQFSLPIAGDKDGR
ncbi:MAG TPA: ATP-binding protein [Casimicrobiaceae bacterium]|nr:ATP-binding protein [Casimicrobiaceae bacterium]